MIRPRQDEARKAMQSNPLCDWKPVELSVKMNCAPSIARAALDGLVADGQAVKSQDTDTYRLVDVRAAILRLLCDQPGDEWTAIGVAEALPHLNLTEQRAMQLLSDLERGDQIIAFYSRPAVQP